MAGLINIFDAPSMSAAINKIKPAETFLTSDVFKMSEIHTTDEISWLEYTGVDGSAQFVNEGEDAILVNKQTTTLKSAVLPRTAEKKIITVSELNKWNALMAMAKSMPKGDGQYDAVNDWVSTELLTLKERAIKLRELMSAQAIALGTITIDQANVSTTIDFGFTTHATNGHLYTLPNGSKWNTTDKANPIETITKYARIVAKRTGKPVTKVIMGETASDYFVNHENVRNVLNANNFKVGVLDITGSWGNGVKYLGSFYGIKFYEYVGSYTLSGVATDMIGANKVIFLGEDVLGYKMHKGIIYDIDASGTKTTPISNDIAIKIIKDNSNQYAEWQVIQKSLPVIHNPDLVYSITVA